MSGYERKRDLTGEDPPEKGWVVRIAPDLADNYIYDEDEWRAREVYAVAIALGKVLGWPRPIAWIGYVDLGEDGVPSQELPEASEWID